MSEGYIYIMTNPCLHDMVKIAMPPMWRLAESS